MEMEALMDEHMPSHVVFEELARLREENARLRSSI